MAKCLILVSLVALSAVTVSAAPAKGGVSCLDQDGKPVDWWVLYKLPTISGNAKSNDGFGYAYTDAKVPLAITGKTLKDETNALGYTLNQIYDSSSTGYVMWNDETPAGKTTSSQAHSKGVMGFDLTGGFNLRHSVPRFPNLKKDSYAGLPDFTKIYGQTFICTSVDLATLNDIAGQYLIAHPLIYDSSFPPGSKSQNLTDLAAGVIGQASSGLLKFKTTGGTPMTDLVKSNKCACDLWDSVVAPTFRQPMNVLTWGRPQEENGCAPKQPFTVQNVQEISWPGAGLDYLETNEHSKWGVTADKNTLCIGDINRMLSQRKRGGGTTCFNAPKQAAAFSAIIKKTEACK